MPVNVIQHNLDKLMFHNLMIICFNLSLHTFLIVYFLENVPGFFCNILVAIFVYGNMTALLLSYSSYLV